MPGRPKARHDKNSGEAAPEFEDLLTANTGIGTPLHVWRKARRRNEALQAQTRKLADSLESVGIPAYQRNNPVSLIGDVTGCVEAPDQFRRIRFLPQVAQQERAPMLNALRYFLKAWDKGPYVRFAVITAGPRIPLGEDLRGEIQTFHRLLSKWASLARQKFDVEAIFRGTEFTIDEARTFHLHANILYAPRRKLTPEQWEKFLAWTRSYVGAHWRDSGRLRKADEAVKYPFKPAEMDHLSPDELAWLLGAIQRLKLMQPMGVFADFCRELDNDGCKIAPIADKQGLNLARVKRQKRDAPTPAVKDLLKPPRENELIARTAPMPRFSPYREPCSVVRNYTPDPKTEGGQFRLGLLKDRAQRAKAMWFKNGGPLPGAALAQAAGNGPPEDPEDAP